MLEAAGMLLPSSLRWYISFLPLAAAAAAADVHGQLDLDDR